MLTSDFDYDLPSELIAQKPLSKRDESRLLILNKAKGVLKEKTFKDLDLLLNQGDLLVFNQSRVRKARLRGVKNDSGGQVELLLLERLNPPNLWTALVKPGRRLKIGSKIILQGQEQIAVKIIDYTDFGGRIVEFACAQTALNAMDQMGEMPLPPYIKEPLTDFESYQTIYSKEEGSKAAPTAGLHFTTALMQRLTAKGVEMAFLTLHVGLGTFKAVTAEKIADHQMHQEFYSISECNLQKIKNAQQQNRRIIAVGTTSVRVLETLGTNHQLKSGAGNTDLFITPGFNFKVINGMITNFHLPKSTLLMMVSAFAGRDNIFKAYQYAITNRFRFFSFGDAMLIE